MASLSVVKKRCAFSLRPPGACPRPVPRHFLVVHPFGQFEQRVFSFATIVVLSVTVSPSQHHRRASIWPRMMATCARDSAAILLLCKSVVLLIHDNEASGSTGAKIAERAPMTIRARPCRILCIHRGVRRERCECNTATRVCNLPELKRALNRSTVCGVSEISGRARWRLCLFQRMSDGLQINFRFSRPRNAWRRNVLEARPFYRPWLPQSPWHS